MRWGHLSRHMQSSLGHLDPRTWAHGHVRKTMAVQLMKILRLHHQRPFTIRQGTRLTPSTHGGPPSLAHLRQAKEDVDAAAVSAAWYPPRPNLPSARASCSDRRRRRYVCDLLAEVETLDNGKPAARPRPSTCLYFRYFAGAIRTTDASA